MLATATEDAILDSAETAKELGISKGALEVGRCRGTIDLPFYRVGKRRVRYRRSDIMAWLAAHSVTPEAPTPKRRKLRRPKASQRVRR